MFKKAVILILVFSLMFPLEAYGIETREISAQSVACIDKMTGTVLYQRDMYHQLPMASTTKIMTCIIACESGGLNREINISRDMLYGCEGTLIYLKANDKISLYDLIKSALIASGNDAANAIAFAVSGSKDSFVALMNKKAEELNMKNTSFKTPSGLDDTNHYSCAYDMAVLSAYAMKNELFSSIVKMKSATITVNGKKQEIYNHNKLLKRDEGFVGVKTGFTKKAGRCLVSDYSYNGADIITVTLNAPDDWDDHLKLVNICKKKYNIKEYCGRVVIPSADGIPVDCKYSYSVNTPNDIYVMLYYYPFIYSPFKSGDKVGYIKVFSADCVLCESEIYIS